MPAAAPAVLLHLLDTQQGDIQHHSRNDSTRCRKACIFTTQKALRENTCAIASVDYSTSVSQRMREHHFDLSNVSLTPENLSAYDCVLLATDHDTFDYELIKENAKLIVDSRGRYLASTDHIVKA